jgi:uncharacterized protein (DUF1778 family)
MRDTSSTLCFDTAHLLPTKTERPSSAAHKERIDARLTAEAKQQIDQAAALQGRSTSDFMVQAALKEAAQVIEQQRIIRLTIEESLILAELMTRAYLHLAL